MVLDEISTVYMIYIITLVVLIFLSAFFSICETCFMSLSKIKIKYAVDQDIKKAKLVQKLIEDPNRLLNSILIGKNLANISASTLATFYAIEYFGNIGVGIATGVMTLVILIFGEIIPKSLASKNPEKVALKVSRPIFVIIIFLTPIACILTFIRNIIIKIFGGKTQKNQVFVSINESNTIINIFKKEGMFYYEEQKMIRAMFNIKNLKVKDLMIPRTNIVTLNKNSTYNEFVNILKGNPFSQFPVYEGSNDNIVGIVHVKDLVLVDSLKDKKFKIEEYMREPYFTYEFKSITELFVEMRIKNRSIAIVLDEYGGTAGLITTQNLLERLMGEIVDNYDDEIDSEFKTIRDGEYIVKGITKIDKINKLLGINIKSEEFDSIGGFIVGLLGRFPEVGETIKYNRIKFIIEDIDNNRIERLRILR